MTELADLLLRGGTVITMDKAGRIYEPGFVVVRGDSIIAVGGPEVESQYQARETLDCAGHVVMPGLVNAHTHLPMSLLRGMADDLRLDVWLHGYMMPVERQFVDAEFCRWGTYLACLEMIRGGVTCFADMYYFEHEIAAAAAEAGLRGVCGQTILKFPAPDAASYDESLAACRRFIEQWKGHPLIVPAPAPHAPYTCTTEILLEARNLAQQADVPLLIHLCETLSEVQEWQEQYGCSPVQWVDELGLLQAKVLAAHCTHVEDDDMRRLERAGAAVAHNPSSNLKLASGITPVSRMEEVGVLVGLGTDGAASNNDLDMFEELRLAALLAKGASGDPTALPARLALAMATINGAGALFLDHLIGSLEAGKRADIIVVCVDEAHNAPRYALSENNIYSRLVYAAKASDVRDTIVNGRVLMRDRQVLTLDAPAILAQAQAYADRINDFVLRRERNLIDKLVALGEIEHEETFEVQVKARIRSREAIETILQRSQQLTITKHTEREQYDTYFLFADPSMGRVRYREDNVMTPAAGPASSWDPALRVAPEYRLTWIGPGNEREYANSAILTRSRYDAVASRSLRFYREYFQPAEIREVIKHRKRYRVRFQGLEFAINLDQLRDKAGDGTFLEIKSRTWSAKDALRKAELISELLALLGVEQGDIVRGEYFSF